MAKLPSKSETVPAWEPSTETVAPGRASEAPSVILPRYIDLLSTILLVPDTFIPSEVLVVLAARSS